MLVVDVRPFSKMERILIIEDETPMRTALADVLAGEGYRPLTRRTASAACAKPWRKSPISSSSTS